MGRFRDAGSLIGEPPRPVISHECAASCQRGGGACIMRGYVDGWKQEQRRSGRWRRSRIPRAGFRARAQGSGFGACDGNRCRGRRRPSERSGKPGARTYGNRGAVVADCLDIGRHHGGCRRDGRGAVVAADPPRRFTSARAVSAGRAAAASQAGSAVGARVGADSRPGGGYRALAVGPFDPPGAGAACGHLGASFVRPRLGRAAPCSSPGACPGAPSESLVASTGPAAARRPGLATVAGN